MTLFEPAPQRGSPLLSLAMGIVVGLVIVVLAWFALIDPTTGEPAPSQGGTPTHTVKPTPAPKATTLPSQSPSPTHTPHESATTGILTTLPTGSWVTVLDSLKQSGTTPERALQRAAELSKPGYTAVPLDTNAFVGLNAGYYAIVIPGQSSRADSHAVCDAIGTRRGDHCYPREIKGSR